MMGVAFECPLQGITLMGWIIEDQRHQCPTIDMSWLKT
jgi:hypothetical protein